MSDSETLKGTVKWFNDAKGFGFIEHNTGRDVFVHYSVIEASGFKTLKDGEEVTYEIKEGPKGLHAIKVQRSEQSINEQALSEQVSKSGLEIEVTNEDNSTESEDMEQQAALAAVQAEDNNIQEIQEEHH